MRLYLLSIYTGKHVLQNLAYYHKFYA